MSKRGRRWATASRRHRRRRRHGRVDQVLDVRVVIAVSAAAAAVLLSAGLQQVAGPGARSAAAAVPEAATVNIDNGLHGRQRRRSSAVGCGRAMSAPT